jgi:hypothetical protein
MQQQINIISHKYIIKKEGNVNAELGEEYGGEGR